VEAVVCYEGCATVGPTTVNENQLGEEAELGETEIARARCLQALATYQSNTDTRSLNHRDIIASIANGKSGLLLLAASHTRDSMLHQFHNLTLLLWGDTTANHSVSFHSKLKETSFASRTKKVSQSRALNHERQLTLTTGSSSHTSHRTMRKKLSIGIHRRAVELLIVVLLIILLSLELDGLSVVSIVGV